VPGYTGGTEKNPTYEDVAMGMTGHAESVKFEYDPAEISYQDLLAVFFATHDPTQLNRQGADVGPQYRSAIFYASEEERQLAQNFIAQLTAEGVFSSPIVTTLEPRGEFYEAEEYHKNFYNNNPDKLYCQYVINPKLAKLKQKFASLLVHED
jgi:peptide-methionine (S)-S-oxide reductase